MQILISATKARNNLRDLIVVDRAARISLLKSQLNGTHQSNWLELEEEFTLGHCRGSPIPLQNHHTTNASCITPLVNRRKV